MRTLLGVALLILPLALPAAALTPGEEAMIELAGRENASVIPLWPGAGAGPNETRTGLTESVETPPGKTIRIRDVAKPSLVVLPPPLDVKPTGVTFLFAPGGGYGILALQNPAEFSQWAGAMGAHTVVLKYRVPRRKGDDGRRLPLSDAQRGIRLLRARAGELGIDPDRIIMVGSSAGGHLAFNLANNHGEQTYAPIDAADELSARPDAAVLKYAAYLTRPITSLEADPHAHLDQANPERTPPVFMTVTRPDKFTWGNVNAVLLLRKAKVPVEFHGYPEGGHGGCFNKYPYMEFAREAARFLRDQGLLSEAMQKAGDAWLDQEEAEFLLDRETKPTTPAPAIKDALADSKFSAADRRLRSFSEKPVPVLRLWPGDGTHSDDPTQTLTEALPDKGDNILRIQNVSSPTLHVWRPARPDGRAVIIFPGGGYHILAAQHEGTEVAQWLNTQGITAIVAKYRVPRRKNLPVYAVALQDGQRAIRLVRSRAAELGIDPDRIGVLGFSAGGHLAALTAHRAAHPAYEPIDEHDKVSARPDFAILIYPAYLTVERDGGELDPLLAPLPRRDDYPPTFSAVAADDPYAPGALHYFLGLHQARVPAELHVYRKGGHGKGLRDAGYPFSTWTHAAERWLADLRRETTSVTLDQPAEASGVGRE